MMPYLIFTLCLSVLVAMFAVQNALMVPVSFLLWNFQSSLVLVIIGSVAIGAFWAFLLTMWWRFKQGRKLKQCEQEIKRLTARLAEQDLLLAKAAAQRPSDAAPVSKTVE